MNEKKSAAENFINFKKSGRDNEYTAIPVILLLTDAIFIAAILLCVRANRQADGFAPLARFFIAAEIAGIIVTILAFIMFYKFIVVPCALIERIKTKYSSDFDTKEGGYQSTMMMILDTADKLMEEGYRDRLSKKQSEIEAMVNQINPHFLYNTLDTIRGYASIENAEITENMIEILSRLFRYTVSSKFDRVTIAQEIGIAREYIKIQEYRINVKIQMVEIIDDDVSTDEYYVPKMILQPIIENSITHGMPEEAVEYIIKIHVYKTQRRLIISIKDNGTGMSTETVGKLNQAFLLNPLDDDSRLDFSKGGGTGIGLRNINKRIKLMFGYEWGLYCYSSYGEGSVFEISLPAER